MKSKYSTYFPAKLWHERTGRSKPPEGIPHTFDDFYTQCAKSVWDAVLSTGKLKTHDSIMKRAQLSKCEIDCSALLVDESQDLDGAQVDWLCTQAKLYGTHVYFMGDAMQTIYTFRGAKSKNLTQLGTYKSRSLGSECPIQDLSLTFCWNLIM